MMLEKVKNFVRAFRPTRPLDCKHIAKASGSWITQNIPQHFSPPAAKRAALIEARASATEAAGERPLWEGYASVKHYPRSTTGGRSSNQVRTDERMGAFFTWLAAARAPETVVEIGTAFGVSGMYWLDGLELAGQGHLFTFDPNTDWASFARENLAAISDRVTMVSGTFEENASKALVGRNVNIAFIDAIHTSEFVYAQYAMLKQYLEPGAIVLFDDIGFSPDMRACWEAIARGPEVLASVCIGGRVGAIEVSDANEA